MKESIIISSLQDNTASIPHAPAVVDEANSLTYAALWERVEQYASHWAGHGIQPGHIIVLSFPNSVELAVVFLSLLRMGAIPLIVGDTQEESINFDELNVYGYLVHPRNTFSVFHKKAMEHNTAHAGASFFLLRNEHYRPQTAPTDTALLITSSGSTSQSKVIKLSATGILKNVAANVASLGILPTDVTIVALPMNYSYGLIGQFLSHLYAGSKIVLADVKFAITQIPKLVTQHKVTSIFTAPPMIRQINYLYNKGFYREDFSSLRYVTVGGNHIERSSLLKSMKIFKCGFVKTYGLAEAGPRVATNKINSVNCNNIDAVGKPINGVKIRIVDEAGLDLPANTKGRVIIESPCVTSGYLNAHSDRITPGQRILTEDIGFLSEAGDLTVLGRRNESIQIKDQTFWFRDLADVIYSTDHILKLSFTKTDTHVEIDAVAIANCNITEESIYLILCENFQIDVWDQFKIRVLKGTTVKVVK